MNIIQKKITSEEISKKKFKIKDHILILLLIPLFIYLLWLYITKKSSKNKFFFSFGMKQN